MPRNDQVSRQWYLLRQLESPRSATLRELVDALPEDFPKNPRTIRRDLEALEVAGFPLTTDRVNPVPRTYVRGFGALPCGEVQNIHPRTNVRGVLWYGVNGQTRWKSMEGFRHIPALAFSTTELMALIFSRNLLKPLEGTELQSSLTSALNKASATLARHEVDPYRLWYAAGGLYLIAHCHLRKDVRMFAVERIRSISLTDHPYQMPLGFDIEGYVQDAIMVMRGRRIEVELLFSKTATAWVKDKVWHPSQETSLLKDGRLKMTLKVADTTELVGWVLSFGSLVRVKSPESLREKVKEEVKKVLGLYRCKRLKSANT